MITMCRLFYIIKLLQNTNEKCMKKVNKKIIMDIMKAAWPNEVFLVRSGVNVLL